MMNFMPYLIPRRWHSSLRDFTKHAGYIVHYGEHVQKLSVSCFIMLQDAKLPPLLKSVSSTIFTADLIRLFGVTGSINLKCRSCCAFIDQRRQSNAIIIVKFSHLTASCDLRFRCAGERVFELKQMTDRASNIT